MGLGESHINGVQYLGVAVPVVIGYIYNYIDYIYIYVIIYIHIDKNIS